MSRIPAPDRRRATRRGVYRALQKGVAVLPELLKVLKGYGNVSEYVRSLLRDAQAKEEDARLEALLLEGLASKRIPLNEDFWTRMEAKTEAIIDKHNARKVP